jgi:transposase InsO family protein
VYCHANAKLNFNGRVLLVERVKDEKWTLAGASAAAGCSAKTGGKWFRRFQSHGYAGLEDKSCAPNVVANKTAPELEDEVCFLRRTCRMDGETIAEILGMAQSTVSVILQRNKLSKVSDIEPVCPPNRWQRRHGGELVHIDIKRLPRFDQPGHAVTRDRTKNTRRAGYEYLHVAIDSASRVGFALMMPDQSKHSAVKFLLAALKHYRSLGIKVTAIMTDNGGCYRSLKHRRACLLLSIKHKRTRPYTPKTNGKAERFIQTLLRKWVYGRVYQNSNEGNAALPNWLYHYNHERKHRGINRETPIRCLRALQAEQCA